MQRDKRENLIARYRAATIVFNEAVELASGRLDESNASPAWSPRQIIHHLADAELRSTVRLRQLLVEPDPVIQGYDEELYAATLPSSRSISGSLEVIRVARDSNIELLDLIQEDEWGKTGTHTDSGRYSLDDWLQIYSEHPFEHAAQIKQVLATPAGEG